MQRVEDVEEDDDDSIDNVSDNQQHQSKEESVMNCSTVECEELEISAINRPFTRGAKSNFTVLRVQKSNNEMALTS